MRICIMARCHALVGRRPCGSLHVFALAVCCVLHSLSWAQEIHVGVRVPISPPESGWHNWIDVAADPNDFRHLIACGHVWSSRTNSLSGFLYASFDGGKTWQLTIEDTASAWVSEESCAFGSDGRAYFVAEAAKTVDGRVHPELGQTHLYHSTDAGRSWSTPLVRGWADFSAMAVDSTQGPYRGRLYVFYNGVVPGATESASRSEIRLLHSADGGKTLNGPVAPPAPTGFRYLGTYPQTARVLRNGSVIAVFLARRASVDMNKAGVHDTCSAEVVRSEEGGKTLSTPIVVGTSKSCAGSKPTMAVDESDGPLQGRIYITYVDGSSGGWRIMLSRSSDNGKTWSPPVAVHVPNGSPSLSDSGSDPAYATIGVNPKGVIGLAWPEKNKNGDCWRFSASMDGGISFQPSVPISRCPANPPSNLQFLHHYLMSAPFIIDNTHPRPDLSELGFSVYADIGGVWKTNMAVTLDGIFHPVWMENLDGGGQIWTTAITVGESVSARSIPQLETLEDVSSQVTFEFANNYYDDVTHFVSLDVGVINKGQKVLSSPLLMQVTGLRSDLGAIEADNADNGQPVRGAIWDLSGLLPDGVLAPGAPSGRRRLMFHIAKPKLHLPPVGLMQNLVIVQVQAKMFGTLVSSK